MRELVVPAPAKLNLFLHVVGRRSDGYHELESLMVLLDFGDTLGLSPRRDGEINLCSPLPGVAPEDDLCVRAARLLKRETGSALGADIRVEKRIPLGSGMGGGSSDAASVLLALNRVWELRLGRKALMTLGSRLGADVPFFLFGEPALARGVGEKLCAVSIPVLSVVIAVPAVPVPTPLVFQAPDLKRDSERMDSAALTVDYGRNDLEAPAARLYPGIVDCAAALDMELTGGGAPGENYRARMSGSGGCVFRLLSGGAPDESSRRRLLAALPAGALCVSARTLSRHPLCDFAER